MYNSPIVTTGRDEFSLSKVSVIQTVIQENNDLPMLKFVDEELLFHNVFRIPKYFSAKSNADKNI